MTRFEQHLVEILAGLTEVAPASISLDATFDQQGVDSFIALRLAREIFDRTGIEIELELLFDYPSISQLAQYLASQTPADNRPDSQPA